MNAGTVEPFAAPALSFAPDTIAPDGPTGPNAVRYYAGHAEGYGDGLAQARAELEAARVEHRAVVADHVAATERLRQESTRLAAAIVALEAAAADLRARDTVAVADVESAVVELAVELTAVTLQRDIDVTESALDSLRRAAPLVPDRGTPVVRVHPDVLAAVGEHVRGSTAEVRFRGAEVVGDPAISPGGCVIDVGACRVDAQLSTAVQRLRDALA